MSRPVIFGIYGKSDSGKTTVIVRLITRLIREGYKVATIKRSTKKISMDSVNKDTWRHRKAGACLVVFSSLCETNFLLNEVLSTSEIIRKISLFGPYDIVLIEGANDPYIPKIQFGNGKQRSNTVATYDGNLKEILSLIRKELQKKPSVQHLVLWVNDKIIPLTDFPERIISHTIIGMLGSLKGVKDIKDVTIKLKREKIT